jgi:hypothetical protein
VTDHNNFITDLEVLRLSSLENRKRDLQRPEDLLKTKGYHIEHNFGHGEQASVLAPLSLIALAFTLFATSPTASGARRGKSSRLADDSSTTIFEAERRSATHRSA